MRSEEKRHSSTITGQWALNLAEIVGMAGAMPSVSSFQPQFTQLTIVEGPRASNLSLRQSCALARVLARVFSRTRFSCPPESIAAFSQSSGFLIPRADDIVADLADRRTANRWYTPSASKRTTDHTRSRHQFIN